MLWSQIWDSDPDTYGVWRSSRTRKIPSRYVADNDSDSDYDGAGKNNYRRYSFILAVVCVYFLSECCNRVHYVVYALIVLLCANGYGQCIYDINLP